MHDNSLLTILVAATGLLTFVLAYIAGFVVGYGFHQLRGLFLELQTEYRLRRLIDEDTDSQVVDDSPIAVACRKDAKMRKGEDEDDEDSQIVTTKSANQKRLDSQSEADKKLDKWMPGVKRGD